MLPYLIFYNLLVLLLTPVWWPAVLLRNLRRGRPALNNRFTRDELAPLQGKKEVVWLHCVSMGESTVGAMLYRRLAPKLPGRWWLFTATTKTGHDTLERLLASKGLVRYFPLDYPWIVSRALRAVRPRLLILVEGELWPNMIYFAHRHGVKIVVVNGRISDRASRRLERVSPLMRPFLRLVDAFFVQTDRDADRFVMAGAPRDRLQVTGNIKFDLEPPKVNGPDPDSLGLTGGPIVVAGSTHQGEEEMLLEAYRLLCANRRASLIIAPRHLERLPEIRAILEASGLAWGLRSEPPAGRRDILLVDTMGELMGLYQSATVVFIGGSLVPIGGHNPIEASLLGRPVLFGPHMNNFREVERLLLAAGAARQVRSVEELARAFGTIIEDHALAREMGRRGQAAVAGNRGAAERTAELAAALMED